MSVGPPAGNGTTRRNCWPASDCAVAYWSDAARVRTSVATQAPENVIRLMIVHPDEVHSWAGGGPPASCWLDTPRAPRSWNRCQPSVGLFGSSEVRAPQTGGVRMWRRAASLRGGGA